MRCAPVRRKSCSRKERVDQRAIHQGRHAPGRAPRQHGFTGGLGTMAAQPVVHKDKRNYLINQLFVRQVR